MNIGIIGLGSIGERHARNLQALFPRAKINVLTKRKSWADAGQHTRLMQDECDFFATPYDVYFITNETYKHQATLRTCLEHSPKGIFMEKPLSHQLDGLELLIKEAHERGAVFFVGYQLHFSRSLQKVKKELESKTIGVPLSMRIFAGQDLRTWRARDYRKNYAVDADKGGGVVLDLIHDLNYPAWLLGQRLEFKAGMVAHVSTLKINSEDIAEGIFITPSGCVVTVHLDYFAIPGGRRCEILGTGGKIVWEMAAGWKESTILIVRNGKEHRIGFKEERNTLYQRELREFMRHVRAEDRYSNASEALYDLQVAHDLRRSR